MQFQLKILLENSNNKRKRNNLYLLKILNLLYKN